LTNDVAHMVLATLPGIGERLMKRLDDHFGGRENEVMQTLQSGDISRIAEVEGISVKRALQLARQVHGTDGPSWQQKNLNAYTHN